MKLETVAELTAATLRTKVSALGADVTALEIADD